MEIRNRLLIAGVSLLTLGAAVDAAGRVYLRWRGSAAPTRALAALGGRPAYQSDISINGSPGHLSLYGFDEATDLVKNRLGHLFPGVPIPPPGGVSRGIVPHADGYLRLVILDLATRNRLLVFAIEQTPEAYQASRTPPTTPNLHDVPSFPGSRVTFTAADAGTRCRLVTLTTDAPAGTVRAFYSERLPAAGWRPAFPPSPRAPSLRIFRKPQALCCVLIEPTPAGTRITLLHKQETMK